MSYYVSLAFAADMPTAKVYEFQEAFYQKTQQWLEKQVNRNRYKNLKDVSVDAIIIDEFRDRIKFKTYHGVECLIYYSEQKHNDTIEELVTMLEALLNKMKLGYRYWRSGEDLDDASIHDNNHELSEELNEVFMISKELTIANPPLLI